YHAGKSSTPLQLSLSPMAVFGSFALILALVLSFYCFAAGAWALFRGAHSSGSIAVSPFDRLSETARRAGIATFVCVTVAAFALVVAVLRNDFSIEYIREHSNIALPDAYKVSALWSGQEGSLVFWGWLLSLYAFVVRVRHRVDVKLSAYASV